MTTLGYITVWDLKLWSTFLTSHSKEYCKLEWIDWKHTKGDKPSVCEKKAEKHHLKQVCIK